MPDPKHTLAATAFGPAHELGSVKICADTSTVSFFFVTYLVTELDIQLISFCSQVLFYQNGLDLTVTALFLVQYFCLVFG